MAVSDGAIKYDEILRILAGKLSIPFIPYIPLAGKLSMPLKLLNYSNSLQHCLH